MNKKGFTPLQILHGFLSQFTLPKCDHIALRKCKFRGDNSSGFTLTELLIVVIIVGILATLALPMLVKTLEKAKLGEAASNLNLIRTGEKIYFLEYSQFWYSAASSDGGLDGLNIENPNNEARRYFDYTIQGADGTDFTVRAQRKNTAPAPYKDYYYEITKNGNITSNGPLSP